MTTSRFSYNEIPYPTVPRWQTHPNHLATLARLFGMEPAPIEGCRVLDLGCGNGYNLIPMAYQLPESEFVGVDLSPTQIADGQAQVDALGLNNITLQAQNILELGPEWGQFDYIIVYGVYSWVTPELQQKILDFCRQSLSPQGVAYISYNAYPGWHMHGLVRDMMLYYTRHLSEPYPRAEQARQHLDFFAETIPTLANNLPDPLKISSLIFSNLRDLLQAQPDEYLLHDHLETINEPLYLYQFVERAEQYGLQYLAEAESAALMARYLPPRFAEAIQERAKTELELEQLMDFLYMRSFRQTLLCHQNVSLERRLEPEALKSLYIASSARPLGEEINLHTPEEVKFRSLIGTTLTTNQPISKAALLYLSEIWPQAVTFDKLLATARSRLNPRASLVVNAATLAREIETLGSFLLKGYALNLVEFFAYAPHFVLEAGDYPTASHLARLQAQESRQVTNQRHEIVTLEDELGLYLLPYLDGEHSRAQLLDMLVDLVSSGTLVVQTEDQAEPQPGRLRQTLAEVLAQSLEDLGRKALLIG